MNRNLDKGLAGWVNLILGFAVVGLLVVGAIAFLVAIVQTFILG